MRVVCIHSSESEFMKSHNYTVGKQYDCVFVKEFTLAYSAYFIKNDNGIERSFTQIRFDECFVPISKIREDKLKEIGI